MKSITISAKSREAFGTKNAKELRREGFVPCVAYGGEKPVHFYAPELSFKNLVYTPDVYTVEFDVDGNKFNAVMQDIQFHSVTDKILHIDFIQLFDDKEVVVQIPVNLVGNAIGVRNGGKLNTILRKLKVSAIPANLPDSIEINIEKLRIGQAIRVSDMQADGYSILNADSAVIVAIKTARNAVDEDEETEEDEEGAEGAAENAEATTEAAAE